MSASHLSYFHVQTIPMKELIVFLTLTLFLSCKDSTTSSSINNFEQIPSAISPIAVNELPKINNVSIQKSGVSYKITFDLEDDDESLDISIYGIDESNSSLINQNEFATGDIGPGISPGNNKVITWNPQQSFDGFQIIADDLYEPTVEEVLRLVSSDRIKNDLLKIEGIRDDSQGRELLEKTRAYLNDQFEQSHLGILDHTFQWNGITGHNLVGTLGGINTFLGRYAVSGHYDTVGSTPGSDDNASGTVGMLEVMRILSLFRFDRTMDFIGFDLEERGLRGARQYVQDYAKDQFFEGLINFEMIGYTCRSSECEGFTLADTSIYNIANPSSNQLQDVFLQAGSNFVSELKIQSVVADSDPNFRRSDHAPFWDAGLQALFITDGANFRNPHYHQPTDRIGTIDIDFTTQIVKTTIATLFELGNPRHVGMYRSDL